MITLAQAVVRDLRSFAVDLLDPGLAPATRHQNPAIPGSLASLLESCSALIALVPRLLDELDVSDFSLRDEEHLTAVPLRATLPRRAMDYERRGDRMLPRRWTTIVPVLESDVRPLGWLLHIIGLARVEAERASRRLTKRIEEALRSRSGTSVFARAESEALRALLLAMEDVQGGIDRAERGVLERASWRQTPTARMPRPFPRGPSWTTLRRISEPLVSPLSALPSLVQGLLRQQTAIADLPFLYQRWCGVKVVLAMQSLGFEIRDDPSPALFLGGSIRFVRDGVSIILWCEPRLKPRTEHESGLGSTRGEFTPDYVFITPGAGGEDAFVLDPTLDHDPDVRAAKSRYIAGLVFRRPKLLAGVPVVRHPLRSWSAAPMGGSHCFLESSDGSKGTVPMDPCAFDPAPLARWLGDVAAHAEAWA